jgi:hypothetical protein
MRGSDEHVSEDYVMFVIGLMAGILVEVGFFVLQAKYRRRQALRRFDRIVAEEAYPRYEGAFYYIDEYTGNYRQSVLSPEQTEVVAELLWGN